MPATKAATRPTATSGIAGLPVTKAIRRPKALRRCPVSMRPGAAGRARRSAPIVTPAASAPATKSATPGAQATAPCSGEAPSNR